MFNCVLHICHLAGPEAAVLRAPPIVDELNRHRVVEELAGAPVLDRDDQSAVLEQAQVMHHADARRIEVCGQFADGGAGRGPEQIENAPPGGMAERVEDLGHVVERGGERLRRNHMSENTYI